MDKGDHLIPERQEGATVFHYTDLCFRLDAVG
jgi:hypothetical protein